MSQFRVWRVIVMITCLSWVLVGVGCMAVKPNTSLPVHHPANPTAASSAFSMPSVSLGGERPATNHTPADSTDHHHHDHGGHE